MRSGGLRWGSVGLRGGAPATPGSQPVPPSVSSSRRGRAPLWQYFSSRGITDPEKSRAFYEALGFTFERDMDIVRNGELEATNYFFSIGDQKSVLELTYNHDGRTYDIGTAYGHIAVGVDDLEQTLEQLKRQGIEPERAPYRVREGGSLLCFVQDPDG